VKGLVKDFVFIWILIGLYWKVTRIGVTHFILIPNTGEGQVLDLSKDLRKGDLCVLGTTFTSEGGNFSNRVEVTRWLRGKELID